tara:strand:- start:1892 stop:2302 length:411 start_codon:yes stop_codon:yes gene_type:complete
MIVLNVLSKFFSGVWEFLKSTLFSKEWWDKYYWIPVAFLVGLILWILSGGRKNPTEKVVKRLNDIKKSERKNIAKIKKEATDKESEVESEAKEQKEDIQKEADRKVKDARDKLKKENKKLEDDSEAVNDILNDILD